MELGRWAHLGHRLGECWADESRDIAYIHIPKNASSFVKGVLIGARGFWHHSETSIKCNENLIMLRDPIDRWASGIAQYLYNTKQDLSIDEIFDKITFDDHTELQTYFLQDVDVERCTFLKVNQNLRTNIKLWLDEHGYSHNEPDVPNINQGNQLIKDRVAAMVDGNSQIKLKLVTHYEQDYALINRVKFYGT